MKKTFLAIALTAMGITIGTQAAEQFLGDGIANPIVTTGTAEWNSTSNFWLTGNTGSYGTWTDGNDANIVGANPVITISDPVSVININRSGTQSGRSDYVTTNSGVLTVNGTISGSTTRQLNFGAANDASKSMSWGGDITIGSGVNRFLLTSVQTIAPNSSITAASTKVIRLGSSVSTNFSNMAAILTGGTLQNWNTGSATDVTIGYLTGNGSLDVNGSQITTFGTIIPGGSNTIGSLTGDMNITLGSGTHIFNISTNNNDLVGGTGAIVYGGTLELTLEDGKTLAGGETFNLFNGSSYAGSFDSIDESGLGLIPPMTINYDNLVIDGTITVVDGIITDYDGDLYLGNGSVYTNLTGDVWTTNSAVWGVYPVAEASGMTNWIDNSDVFIIGSGAKTISLQTGLDVSVGTLTWQSPTEALTITGDVSSVITITNEITSTSTKQININNWKLDGNVSLSNLSRLNFANDGALTPGSSLTTDNGSDIQLSGTFTDLSSNPITLGGNDTQIANNTGSDITIASLTGRGALNANTNSVSYIIGSYNIGGDDSTGAIDNGGNANIILSGSAYTNEITVFNLSGGADRLGTTETITFGGDLVVVIRPSSTYQPRLGDSFNLFNYGSFSGSFNSITLPPLSGDLVWHNNIYTDGTIKVGKAGVDYNRVVFTEFGSADFEDDAIISSGTLTNADGTVFTLELSVGGSLSTNDYSVNLYSSDIAGLNSPAGIARLDSGLNDADSADDEVIRIKVSTSGATLKDLAFGGIEINSFGAGESAGFGDHLSGTVVYSNETTGAKFVTPDDALSGLEPLSLANVSSWYLEISAKDGGPGASAPTTRFSMDDVKFVYAVDPASSWLHTEFGLSGTNAAPDFDYDGDGLTNIEEYGLGGNPTNSLDTGIAPTTGSLTDGGTNYFEYVHAKRSDPLSGITYDLETTENLVFPSWTNGSYTVAGTGTIDSEFDSVTNRTPTDVDVKFTQLIIEEN
jgi:hypothetical protein